MRSKWPPFNPPIIGHFCASGSCGSNTRSLLTPFISGFGRREKATFSTKSLKTSFVVAFALSHAGQPRGVTEKHLSTQPGLKRAAPGSSPDGVPRRRLPGRKRIDRRGFGGQALPLETTPPLHVARVMVYGIHL